VPGGFERLTDTIDRLGTSKVRDLLARLTEVGQ